MKSPPGIRRPYEEIPVSGQRRKYGRIRGVVAGPDSRLYFLTSNRDGRGDSGRNDDRIIRITYRGPAR